MPSFRISIGHFLSSFAFEIREKKESKYTCVLYSMSIRESWQLDIFISGNVTRSTVVSLYSLNNSMYFYHWNKKHTIL